jgi:hypothetical protein
MKSLSTEDFGLIREFWDKKVVQLVVASQKNATFAKAIATYSQQFMAHYGIGCFC